MSIFKKSDMVYNYTWSGMDQQSHLFDPMDGEEVLSLINKFLEAYNLKSVASGSRSEQLLRKRLPAKQHTREEIFDFLQQNY